MAIATESAANSVPARQAPKPVRVVSDSGPLAHLLDTARFEHLQRIALIMATASLIPDHLKGRSQQETLGNCFLVVNQSLRWGLDPFAVAAETYSVSGKLGFQGKLIAALVNARSNLEGKLKYEFKGTGDNRTVTVIGRFADEDFDRTVDLSVGQAKTSNKMWTNDPDQKLIYSAATKWARRHCPEVLLGVLTDDDLERIAESQASAPRVTQQASATLEDLTDRLTAGNGLSAGEIPLEDPVSEAPVEDGPQRTTDEAQATEADPHVDLLDQLYAKLENVETLLHCDEAGKWAKGQIENLPDAVATQIDLAVKFAQDKVRKARGQGSNK